MKRNISITKLIFGIYCLLLIWVVIFKISISWEEVRMLAGSRSFNWIPFYYDCTGSYSVLRRETLLNVVVFLPFGVYLKMLGKPMGKTILWGFLVSASFELVQFIFSLGATDITDLIANTMGVVIGALGYAVARMLFKTKKKLDRLINILALVAMALFALVMAVLFLANK
jgi:glycopeptide antibiotics resistance protein